jgi:hypothetical protein
MPINLSKEDLDFMYKETAEEKFNSIKPNLLLLLNELEERYTLFEGLEMINNNIRDISIRNFMVRELSFRHKKSNK